MVTPGRIDFHNHFVPAVYREKLAAAGVDTVGRVPFPAWDTVSLFERMDLLDIDRAILSISAPGVDFGSETLAVDLARSTNDLLLDLRTAHPARLGGFATLPMPHIDAALAEFRRLEGSGMEGVILLTSYGGRYWSDPAFAPILEALDASSALVLLHPGIPAGSAGIGLSLPPPILEFVFDTTRAVADMIFEGVFDRYPRIRWVLSHLGGTLPYVSWRMSMIEHSDRTPYAAFQERGRTVTDYLQNLYYDTAVSAGPASLRAILEIVGPDRLVFGSDIPFLPLGFAQKTAQALDNFEPLSTSELEAINFRNGLQLLRHSGL